MQISITLLCFVLGSPSDFCKGAASDATETRALRPILIPKGEEPRSTGINMSMPVSLIVCGPPVLSGVGTIATLKSSVGQAISTPRAANSPASLR